MIGKSQSLTLWYLILMWLSVDIVQPPLADSTYGEASQTDQLQNLIAISEKLDRNLRASTEQENAANNQTSKLLCFSCNNCLNDIHTDFALSTITHNTKLTQIETSMSTKPSRNIMVDKGQSLTFWLFSCFINQNVVIFIDTMEQPPEYASATEPTGSEAIVNSKTVISIAPPTIHVKTDDA